MSDYALYFLTGDGRVPAMDFAVAADDAEAVRSALAELRRHGTCNGVEVFDGHRLVARVEMPVDPTLSSGTTLHGAH